MSTTTIRLSEELRARVARAAERAGTTAHGFMLDAIAEKTDAEERRTDLEATAERRFAQILASGRTVPWTEMRSYLEQRLAGRKPKRPAAKKPSR